MTSKDKYLLLDRLNLCHRCEKAKPAPGRKFCFSCLEKIAAYNAQHYNRNKAKDYQERRRELYRQKKDKGICVRCSKPATHGLYCYECSIKVKKHNIATSEKRKRDRLERGLIPEKRKALGLCVKCGNSADIGNYCSDCMTKMREALDIGRGKSPFRDMERKRIEEVKRRKT